MWLIIIGVLLIIGVFSVASEKNSANEIERQKYVHNEVKEHINKRVLAYADYLRRTSSDEIRAMSNNELHVMIENAMEAYEKAISKTKRRSNIMFVLSGIFAIAVFSNDSQDDFAKPLLFLLFFIAFALREWGKNRVDKRFLRNGWEPARLKLE